MENANGVLADVRGDEVSAALNALPQAAEGCPDQMTAETESIHHGRVVMTFRLVVNKRGKMRYCFWSPVHAAPIPTDQA